MKPQLICVSVADAPNGYLYATSSEVEGLHVMERSRSELARETGQAIAALFAARGQRVTTQEVPSHDDGLMIWVAVPVSAMLEACA